MEEEGFRNALVWILFRKFDFDADDAVQSDFQAGIGVAVAVFVRAKTENCVSLHSKESASFGHGLGCILSGPKFPFQLLFFSLHCRII